MSHKERISQGGGRTPKPRGIGKSPEFVRFRGWLSRKRRRWADRPSRKRQGTRNAWFHCLRVLNSKTFLISRPTRKSVSTHTPCVLWSLKASEDTRPGSKSLPSKPGSTRSLFFAPLIPSRTFCPIAPRQPRGSLCLPALLSRSWTGKE